MNGPKPFTTSLLPGRGLSRHGEALSPQSGDLWLRFTLLEDEAFSSLVESISSLGQEQPLELGDGRYRCTLLATTSAQSPWACCVPFESLLEDASDDPTATLRFLSLTTFRSSGHRNVLFPDPSLVFGSLLARWNASPRSTWARQATPQPFPVCGPCTTASGQERWGLAATRNWGPRGLVPTRSMRRNRRSYAGLCKPFPSSPSTAVSAPRQPWEWANVGRCDACLYHTCSGGKKHRERGMSPGNRQTGEGQSRPQAACPSGVEMICHGSPGYSIMGIGVSSEVWRDG